MAERPVPVEEVSAMVSHGFSERDIIRQLKAQGYSFGDIERAIMEVVKSGVAPATAEPAQPQPVAPYKPPVQPPAPRMEAQRPSRRAYAPPDVLEPLPPLPVTEPEEVPEEVPAEEEQQQYVEDIVESVLEEKFEKFMSELKTMKEEFEQLRSEVQSLKERRPDSAEMPAELMARLEDVEARTGGLEKAFRQYLPQLAQSIERLSKMMKREA